MKVTALAEFTQIHNGVCILVDIQKLSGHALGSLLYGSLSTSAVLFLGDIHFPPTINNTEILKW